MSDCVNYMVKEKKISKHKLLTDTKLEINFPVHATNLHVECKYVKVND